jgi:hypothetical protein
MEGAATVFAREQFGAADLGDKRLNRRLQKVVEQVVAHPSVSFPKRFHDPVQLQAFYRLMKHKSVSHGSVLAPHLAATHERMRKTPGVVLCLHDTTVLDYSGLTAIKELGQIGNGNGRGLNCHNCLAVAVANREVLGLAGQILHRRRKAPAKETRAARRKHPQRESALWKKLSQMIPTAPADGPQGQLFVDVSDRGSDITEYLDYEEQAGKSYVARSQHNRQVDVEIPRPDGGVDVRKVKLHDFARSLPAQGQRTIEVPAKEGQPARTAKVGVSWQRVKIRPPKQRRGDERGVPLTAWVVRVSEIDPPAGVTPLEWILLTNVPVHTLEDAFERVDWYAMRWIIEEYHKAQKTGCDIENMQFRRLNRLSSAIALLSVAAVHLLTLRDQSRAPDAKERKATTCVPELWVRLLSRWRHKKVRLDWSVHDFFFALARLGGHLNRKHDHAPGWITLWRGWSQLQTMLEAAAALGIA